MLRLIAALLTLIAAAAEALPTGIAGYAGNLGAACDSCHGDGVVPTVRFEVPQQVPAGTQALYRFVVRSNSPAQTVAGFDVAASGGMLALADAPGGDGARVLFGEIVHAAPKPNADGSADLQPRPAAA